jgi:hypothetical protein
VKVNLVKPRRRTLLKIVASAAILLPCLYGFGSKLIALIVVYRGDPEGAFAISPITNYLLASAGFLLLFGWAAANGMFVDIEGPKRTMLDNERRLDEFVPVACNEILRDQHGRT